MVIKQEWPPEEVMALVDAFSPMIRTRKPPICYGETLYNPGGILLTLAQIKHEEFHSARQVSFDGGPLVYVKKYLTDAEFRKNEEALAYVVEMKCRIKNSGATLSALLREYSAKLASPLYGRITTPNEARKILLSIYGK